MAAHAAAAAPEVMAVWETSIRKRWVGSMGSRTYRHQVGSESFTAPTSSAAVLGPGRLGTSSRIWRDLTSLSAPR